MKSKFVYQVILVVVTVFITVMIQQCWSAPASFITKTEFSEAKAHFTAADLKLDQDKLDKEAFLNYAEKECQLRKLITDRQDAQHNYIVELQRQVVSVKRK